MEYTDGQKECMHEFQRWYRTQNQQTFEYDGPAGTGKTTIVPPMIRKTGLDLETEVLCMAYTGRAASNLSLKGLPAYSMHSQLMETIDVPKTDSDGRIIYVNGRPLTSMAFKKRNFLPKSTKMLFIDEGGFVDTEMAKVALSFGLPICVTGDIHQLGPPFGESYFLQNPDYSLTEITRQGKDSGIVELATRIRLGQEIPNKEYSFKNNAFIIPKDKITNVVLEEVDMVVCATNKMRNYFNDRIRRQILGIKSNLPVKGDKIICRKNDWNRKLGDIALTNGILGYVHHAVDPRSIDTRNRTIKIDFRPDYIDWDYYAGLPIDVDFFRTECGPDKIDNWWNKGAKFELGHAITGYIAQGSEFPSVLYWDEYMPRADADFMRRLRYTGVTRGKDIAIYAC
jgi:ATP-dependent exoDNAse (exonuclease V) alpha subunit